LGQAHYRFVRHIGDGASGYVVEHHRQIHGMGDGAEVLEQAFLRRPIVVRHDLQLAIGTDRLGELGQFDGLFGGVGAASGHDGHAASGLLY
jgi:hypothetical protein